MTDLFGSGFVPNLARPGSHVTGFTLFEFSIGSKWLEAVLPVSFGCLRELEDHGKRRLVRQAAF